MGTINRFDTVLQIDAKPKTKFKDEDDDENEDDTRPPPRPLLAPSSFS
jgi:hypothetical protein